VSPAASAALDVTQRSRDSCSCASKLRDKVIRLSTELPAAADSAALPADLERQVADSYQLMLLPVRVTGERDSNRYTIPLRTAAGLLSAR
jgi:hypothetical protein